MSDKAHEASDGSIVAISEGTPEGANSSLPTLSGMETSPLPSALTRPFKLFIYLLLAEIEPEASPNSTASSSNSLAPSPAVIPPFKIFADDPVFLPQEQLFQKVILNKFYWEISSGFPTASFYWNLSLSFFYISFLSKPRALADPLLYYLDFFFIFFILFS